MKTLIIVIIALAIIAGGVYVYRATTLPSNGGATQVACTTEARLCPDGSYVGRIGPDCAFEACPGAGTTVTGSTTSTSTATSSSGTTHSTTTTTVKINY